MRKLLVILLLVCTSLAWAGVSFTNLDHKQAAGPVNNIASNSVTPSANNLVLVVCDATLNSGNGPGAVSTVTGNSLTYVNVASIDFGPLQGTGRTGRAELWRSMGASPTAGSVTCTWATSPTSVEVIVSQGLGVDTTGTNGSGAIGNVPAPDSNGGGSSTPSTLAVTFSSATSGTYAVTTTTGANTITAGTSMTILGNNSSTPTSADEWAPGQVTPATFTFSAGSSWGIIAAEIKASVSGRRPQSLVF